MIVETSSLKIKDIVIRPHDIRHMGEIVMTAAREIEKGKKTKSGRSEFEIATYTKFEIDSEESSYSSSTAEIFKDGGILDRKQIKALRMNVWSVDRFSISINITQGGGTFERGSSLTVSGDKVSIVNGTMRQLEKCFDDCEKQFTLFRRHRVITTVVLGLFACLSLLVVAGFINRLLGRSDQSSEIQIHALAILFILVSAILVFGFAINLFLSDLWPSIEIQTGPEYNRKIRRRRIILGSIITLIVLPTLLQIIFSGLSI